MIRNCNINVFNILNEPNLYRLGVIKLNSKFYSDKDIDIFSKLWKNAQIRASADGGSNIIYDSLEDPHKHLPHFISGDFDSLKPNVKQFYKSNSVQIIHTPDVNETDFTKCLKIMLEKSFYELDVIIAHVGLTIKRLDHTFSNLNTLLSHSLSSNILLILINCDSISFVLPPGNHCLETCSPLRGKWCSLVPIQCPVNISTKGLLYDMENIKLEMSGMISTCNSFSSSSSSSSSSPGVVRISNDAPVLWSMGIKI